MIVRPESMIFGNTLGSFVSSTMLTESSKPTMEKKASAVAPVTARNTLLSPSVSKIITREKSASPELKAKNPTRMTSSRPLSSMRVRTTLNHTLSPTPRRLTAAMRVRKPSAIHITPVPETSQPKPATRFSAKTFEAVDAEVMPELRTAKATRKVTKWMPNALCVYRAAPAAWGYFVTSSI